MHTAAAVQRSGHRRWLAVRAAPLPPSRESVPLTFRHRACLSLAVVVAFSPVHRVRDVPSPARPPRSTGRHAQRSAGAAFREWVRARSPLVDTSSTCTRAARATQTARLTALQRATASFAGSATGIHNAMCGHTPCTPPQLSLRVHTPSTRDRSSPRYSSPSCRRPLSHARALHSSSASQLCESHFHPSRAGGDGVGATSRSATPGSAARRPSSPTLQCESHHASLRAASPHRSAPAHL